MRRQVGYWKKTQTSRAQIGESVVRDQGSEFPLWLIPVPGVVFDRAAVAEHGSAGGNRLPLPFVFVSPSSAGSAVEDHDVAAEAVFQAVCREI